jgi:hypothetical protein
LFMSKGKWYIKAFTNQAIKQVMERGYSAIEIAFRLGLFTKTLYR